MDKLPLNPEKAYSIRDNSDDKVEADSTSEITVEKLAGITEFLDGNSPILASIVGLEGVRFCVGTEYSTDLESGLVTLDARALVHHKQSWNEQGVLHELIAHLRDKITEPETNDDIRAYMQRGKPYALLHNIASDIKGNMEIVKTLPSMREITDELYREGLFEQEDLRDLPRHVQFLYALIMQEMSLFGDRPISMSDDVAEAIAQLRDYEGSGQDAIKYATASFEKGKPVSAKVTLIRTELILQPVMEELLELDRQDKQKKQTGQQQEGEGQQQEGEGQQQEGEGQQGGSLGENEKGDHSDEAFAQDYDDLSGTLHPAQDELIDEDDMAKKIRSEIKKQIAENKPEAIRDKKMRQETGRSFREYEKYRSILDKYAQAIEAMEEFFGMLVEQHRSKRKILSHPIPEGEIIDAEVLPQTYTDVEAGVSSPPAFHKLEEKESAAEVASHFDIVLILDRSSSMAGDKAVTAAEGAVVVLEGLDYFANQIAEAQQDDGYLLDMDVRSAVYVFSAQSDCLKPLSPDLSRKERMDVYFEVKKANGGTADYLALQEARRDLSSGDIANSRRQIVMVVSDGVSNNPAELQSSIDALKADGAVVIGIGIGNAQVASQYGLDGVNLADVSHLPSLLLELIHKHISS